MSPSRAAPIQPSAFSLQPFPTLTLAPGDRTDQPHFVWRKFGPGGPLWEAKTKEERERELGIPTVQHATLDRWYRRMRLDGVKIEDGHAWAAICPPDRYGARHPEYFALCNGLRDCDLSTFDGKHGCQLCTSNPAVVRLVAEYCIQRFDADPTLHAVSISPNDGAGFCECPECVALDSGATDPEREDQPILTDRILAFGNAVAELVARKHPRRKLILFAYGPTLHPPRRVRPHPALIIQYCSHLDRHWSTPMRQADEERLAGWTNWTKNLGIYEYFLEGAWPDLPRLTTPLMENFMRFCHEHGVRYFSPQTGSGFAVNGMNYYACAKLLWSSDTPTTALWEEYCQMGFGPAAEPVGAYFELLRNTWTRRMPEVRAKEKRLDPPPSLHWRLTQLYGKEFLRRCEGLLGDAEKLAEKASDQAVLRRVRFLRRGFDYLRATLAAVEATLRLEEIGVKLLDGASPTEGLEGRDDLPEIALRARRALELWEARDQLVEKLKIGFDISYFWIRYNDCLRQNLYPVPGLKALLEELARLGVAIEAAEGVPGASPADAAEQARQAAIKLAMAGLDPAAGGAPPAAKKKPPAAGREEHVHPPEA